jgi:hypothetical protein
MSIAHMLLWIQETRTMLENLGITPGLLVAAAVVAFLLFVVSVREVLGWYLRLHKLQSQMAATQAQIVQIQTQVAELHQHLLGDEASSPAKTSSTAITAASTDATPDGDRTLFRLDH